VGVLVRIEDLARQALVGVSRGHPERRPRPNGEPLRFIFSIDSEISMGGARADNALPPIGARRRIWGETEQGAFGISRFIELFDQHRMRGVFFLEGVARRLVGEAELAEAARFITERGHDVELHVHPEFEVDPAPWRSNGGTRPSALLHEHSFEEQRRLIRETAAAIERWTGRRPIAFRAGGYSASEVTLRALAAEGLFIDSSYDRWAIDSGSCGFRRELELNDVAVLDGGVLEVPVTNLTARGPRGGVRPMELSSLNTSEVIAALEQMYEAGARVCCAVTHSFRLLRAKDHQYREVVPDLFNLHRLRALLRYLDANRDRFEVVTFRDLPAGAWRAGGLANGSAPFYPTPPLWSSLSRLALQAFKDRGVV
jgi:peptidoglycan/xylan/chitin deacetylase (PgdA/CDA1 family)